MSTPRECMGCHVLLESDSHKEICADCLVQQQKADPTIETKEENAATILVQDSHWNGDAAVADDFFLAKDLLASGFSHLETVDCVAKSPKDRLPYLPEKFEFIRRLGSGGMGNVVLAREKTTNRLLAIKYLNSPGNPQAYDRFLIEIQALAALKHPNIVRVDSVDVDWREPYFAMEYVPGGTFADLVLDEQPLVSPTIAAKLIVDAAEAIASAHEGEILHRDIKPSNILIANLAALISTRDNHSGECSTLSDREPRWAVKVSDFGLAKRTDHDDGLTRTGPLGTPSFMPPEAASGRFREVDSRSDVYGLGATLYFLLTGVPPYQGEDNDSTLKLLLSTVPDRPRSIRPDLPPRLEGIVLKAMERNPGNRYESAKALAADLRCYLDGGEPIAPVLTRLRRVSRWAREHRSRLVLAFSMLIISLVLVSAGRMTVASVPETGSGVVIDPEVEFRAELAKGHPVQLLGPVGLPRYHRMLVEPNAPGVNASSEGACTFNAFGLCLMELMSNPGIDRYKISLELRHLRVRGDSGDEPHLMSQVGFYFGHRTFPHPEFGTASDMFTITYRDLAYSDKKLMPEHPDEQMFRFQALGILESSTFPPSQHTVECDKPFFFIPGKRMPGVWRKIELEISPEFVRVYLPEMNGTNPIVNTTIEKISLRQQILDKNMYLTSDNTVPDWTPQQAFGILAYRACAAVRNVSITPLK